ncbi:hypothetical protein IV203_019776 [Nitzschia inconspicua]|uniref:Uncharacterized protein n=1 Tax=Nitzschia inconspicua TaxID=303405 RepID=A0A9K3M364_9STRA|nr:hypothetical protein IV203_019776 [Nitzschia inconspicua]
MTWKVTFETLRFQSLYQAFSQFMIATAARTVSEAVCLPQMLTLQKTLVMKNNASSDKPWIEARREWLELLWARGGGLTLPSPIPFGDILSEKKSSKEPTQSSSFYGGISTGNNHNSNRCDSIVQNREPWMDHVVRTRLVPTSIVHHAYERRERHPTMCPSEQTQNCQVLLIVSSHEEL